MLSLVAIGRDIFLMFPEYFDRKPGSKWIPTPITRTKLHRNKQVYSLSVYLL